SCVVAAERVASAVRCPRAVIAQRLTHAGQQHRAERQPARSLDPLDLPGGGAPHLSVRHRRPVREAQTSNPIAVDNRLLHHRFEVVAVEQVYDLTRRQRPSTQPFELLWQVIAGHSEIDYLATRVEPLHRRSDRVLLIQQLAERERVADEEHAIAAVSAWLLT